MSDFRIHYSGLNIDEHIDKRPDAYIGALDRREEHAFIMKNGKIYKDKLNISVPLYQIIDEMISNASDHVWRVKESDKPVTIIKITVTKDSVTVLNNGLGIYIEKYEKTNKYIPEIIFTVPMRSSNFNDDQIRYSGGRNGLGVKITVIYSKKFELSTINNGMYYRQTFSDNKTNISKPIIGKIDRQDQTRVVCYPDYTKFDGCTLNDIEPLIRKRVHDLLLFSDDVDIYYNNKCINPKIDHFAYYPTLISGIVSPVYIFKSKCWKISVFISPKIGNKYNKFSMGFVNGMYTSDEQSTHIKYVRKELLTRICDILPNTYYQNDKKDGDQKLLKRNDINKIFSVIINTLIPNPIFDDQKKSKLGTKLSKFGSKPDFTEVKKMMSMINIKKEIDIYLASKKQNFTNPFNKELKKSIGTRIKVDKYIEANALKGPGASKRRSKCGLILTEGDSAMTSITGCFAKVSNSISDYFGVYPVKGKVKNVTAKKNIVLTSSDDRLLGIVKILNLDVRNVDPYSKYVTKKSLEKLRYGSICIAADSDSDGYHIVSLIMNFFRKYWPNLLFKHGYITSLRTHIVKFLSSKKQDIGFYTEQNFENWISKNNGVIPQGYKAKYYKGLATYTLKEMAIYFNDINRNILKYKDTKDVNNCSEGEKYFDIILGRDTKKRKEWVSNFSQKGITKQINGKVATFKEHANVLHIQYAIDDCIRSVPHIMDGLKPSQRKVLYMVSKSTISQLTGIKVNALGGKIIAEDIYHHGEASLFQTIIRMAQSFIGAHNIPWLVGIGQFGSRLTGPGKRQGEEGHGQPRYISVAPSIMMKYLINKKDNIILKSSKIDGKIGEPENYYPIIPTVLVEGTMGIGVGYSSTIPPHNPIDIIDYILAHNRGENVLPVIRPYWRNLKTNNLNMIYTNEYRTYGDFSLDLKNKMLIITELPPTVWTQRYMEFLKTFYDDKIIDFKRFNTDTITNENDWHERFEIELSDGYITRLNELDKMSRMIKIYDDFKLVKIFKLTNMVLFNTELKLQKYKSIYDIMSEFMKQRLIGYVVRRNKQLKILKDEIDILKCKLDYISCIRKHKIIIQSTQKTFKTNEIIAQIDTYIPLATQIAKLQPGKYEFLIRMGVRSFTDENYKIFEKQVQDKLKIYGELENTTPTEIWIDELLNLKRVLITYGYSI